MAMTYSFEPEELSKLHQEFSQQLCDLIRKENINGRLPVVAVAKFLGIEVVWFRKAIQSGAVPFAFSSGASGRETSYISTYAFYNWINQSRPFLIRTNAEKMENATKDAAVVKGQSYIGRGIANRKWDMEERLIKR